MHSPLPASGSTTSRAGEATIPSPSLVDAADGADAAVPAFELKFLLAEAKARALEEWARDRLIPDAHADPERPGQYRTTTLYLDTPALDVLFQTAGFRRRKYRVRRYGRETALWLERKTRRGDRVRKRRDAIAEAGLAQLAPESWFACELAERRLQPACRVSYWRTAFVGLGPDGPLRVTLDREVRGARAHAWRVDAVDDGPMLLAGEVICELKFRASLPALFKSAIATLDLAPSNVSKYRRAMRATDRDGDA